MCFFTISRFCKNANPVTIKVKDAPLETALNLCFENQPLTYSIVGTTIVVKHRNPSVTTGDSQLTNLPLPVDVHGRIVNENGEPVLATVTVKGSKKAVSTDDNGYFSLKGINNDATLVAVHTSFPFLIKKWLWHPVVLHIEGVMVILFFGDR